MQAGRLRHRVELQREVRPRDQDQRGGYAVEWQTFDTVWADIQPVSGNERLFAATIQASTTHKITIRWQGDITAVNGISRVKFGSRVFNVQSVTVPREIRHRMEIMAVEGVAT